MSDYPELQSQFFQQKISAVYSAECASCHLDTSITEAAKLMSHSNCTSILIHDDTPTFVGILTDNDLRNKVIAVEHDLHAPVRQVMSSPLLTVHSDEPIFEAFWLMINKRVKHLGVTDDHRQIIGVITYHKLLLAQGQSPYYLLQEIKATREIAKIAQLQKQIFSLVQTLLDSATPIENINRLVTLFSDTILERIIELAIEELGEPPTEFAFMTLGSEGRREQTLKTDQDNAIIFADPPDEKQHAVQTYFLHLGQLVCKGLDQVGYTYCKGDVMAQNPKWCQPLSGWKRLFSEWITTPEPMAIMQSTIFFDFRSAYGTQKLVNALREQLLTLLQTSNERFFYHLAKDALKLKPPLNWFGGLSLELHETTRKLDIKKAMTPIVDFARIYSLANGIESVNTHHRLHQLHKLQQLNDEEFHELLEAYQFLMKLRLENQVRRIATKMSPENFIDPKQLSLMERRILKEVLTSIKSYQTRIKLKFIPYE